MEFLQTIASSILALIKIYYQNDGGQPEGYVTKDGSWAAIPYHTNHKKLMVIHNGEHMYLAPNYEKAVAYIKKQISIEKKLKKKGSLEKFL